MASRITDLGWASVPKFGEELCGDQVVIHDPHGASPVMVLADGLGSGVKACILATLTAKIIGTMLARAMPLEACVATVISTLPVCEVRKIAYATFTIIRVTNSRKAEIIQYDNPGVILLRNGRYEPFSTEETELEGKRILTSKISLCEGDALLAVSDGAIHAGTGATLNYAWDRDAIIRYMVETHSARLPAKSMCTVLRDHCRTLYGGKAGDDTTACAAVVREVAPVNVLVGPPRSRSDDTAMLERFFALPGKHVVCGGTTAHMAAAHLGGSIREGDVSPDPEIPPISRLRGVDLVTEGALTLARAAAYAEAYSADNIGYDDWCFAEDGASLLARLLLDEATHVTLFAGRAENRAYRDSGLPLGVTVKLRLVTTLAASLEKAGKVVSVVYW